MSIDIWTDSMQHAELFGTPVLFTNWLVQRDTIPQGWHCYDLRGTRKAPNARITLVDQEVGYHAGTVLSPTPLKREGVTSRRVNGTFYLLGEELTLEQFCEEHDLPCPQDIREFVLRPASPNEAGLFFSELEPEKDEALGTIGHVRMDFGHGGREFWHSWWPHNGDRFNIPEFKEVLQRLVDNLRQTGLLKNLGAMDAYCWQHGGAITEDRRSYGYITETENYRFCLRCTPLPGEYQGYLYCYDLRQQELYQQEHPKPEAAKRRNGSVPLLRFFLAACLSAEIFCPLLLIGWPGCLLSTVRALLRQFRRLKQIVAMVTCANQSNHLIPIYYSRQSEN